MTNDIRTDGTQGRRRRTVPGGRSGRVGDVNGPERGCRRGLAGRPGGRSGRVGDFSGRERACRRGLAGPGSRKRQAIVSGVPLLLLVFALSGEALAAEEVPFELPVSTFSRGPSGEPPSQPWWTLMGDDSLAPIIEEGLEANHDLQAAWNRVLQSDAAARRALGPMFPSASFDTSANMAPTDSLGFLFGFRSSSDYGTADPTGQAATELPATYTSGSATLNLRLQADIWGRQYLQHHASRLDAQASRGDRDAQAIALATRIAQAYYDAVAARSQNEVVVHQIEANKTLLELTQLRFERGEATALDVLQQRQQLAATSTLLPQARGQARVSLQQLAILLGRPPQETGLALANQLPDLVELPPVGRPEDLLENRPDLRAALARYEAARARGRSAARAFLPSLSLTGQAGNQALYMSELNSIWFWGVGASLSIPLYEGGSNVAALREARAGERAAYHTLYQLILQAIQDVEQALVLEEEQRLQLEAYRAQLKAADQALEESKGRYSAGLTSYLSVLTAVNARQQAELSVLQAQRQLISTRIQVYDALGGTWPRTLGGAE